MPELAAYPYDPQELETIAASEIAERTLTIDNAFAYYRGKQRKALRVRPGQPDDNIILNTCARVIDQSVSMLVGKLPSFTATSEPGQIRCSQLLHDNEAELFLHNLAVHGAVSGHVFVKLVPDDVIGVRWVNLNPKYVNVFWSPDDMARVTCYSIRWQSGKIINREDIIQDEVGRWIIRRLKKTGDAPWIAGEDMVWMQEFPPIVDWQNLPNSLSYYGDSDIQNTTLNDTINFVASNINRILKFHAHPKTILTGARKGDIDETAVDGLWSLSNPDAKVNNLEMQSDLASSMNFLDKIEREFYAQNRAIDITGIKDQVGQLTNFGLRTMFKDALDKLTTKQTIYGNGLAEILERSGEIIGVDLSEPTIAWADPLPFNDLEQVQRQNIEITLGTLSKQTASQERGRDWETEQQRIQEEKTADSSGLGAVLANAMRDFNGGGNAPA
jgi:hypothetical protein